MFSEQIELRGHIIDSLILPKVLDEILSNGGSFTIREVDIGKQRRQGLLWNVLQDLPHGDEMELGWLSIRRDLKWFSDVAGE